LNVTFIEKQIVLVELFQCFNANFIGTILVANYIIFPYKAKLFVFLVQVCHYISNYINYGFSTNFSNYLVAKMESGHQVGLDILKFKMLFTFMFIYMKLFDFVISMFKNHMFEIGLYIFIKIK
jgi:hypothetical protein